ncbi:MAG: hypothetical protein CFE26_00145 [Verrucomicrobiales bacterium VVV1]|nr:MAG: hypothetical protein CFE26_00145 [Verrucomicrobiales bacterium VVV1]
MTAEVSEVEEVAEELDSFTLFQEPMNQPPHQRPLFPLRLSGKLGDNPLRTLGSIKVAVCC